MINTINYYFISTFDLATLQQIQIDNLLSRQCVFMENINTRHNEPRRVIGNFSGEGCLKSQNCYAPKLEFLEGRVGTGGGVSNQSVGEVWIFLEQPNLPFKTGERLRLRWLGRVLRLQQPCHSTYANRCQCLQTRAHLTTVFLDRNWKIERIISSDNDIQ